MDKPLVLHSASITVVASCYCGKRFTQGLSNAIKRSVYSTHTGQTEFYGDVICPDCGQTYKTAISPQILVGDTPKPL